MTITIDSIHMPLEVERGMQGGPAFFTTLQTTPNAIKSAISARAQALMSWQVGLIGLRDDQIKNMLTFFYGRRGPARGFLFKDWSDYKMPLQGIGTGNGANKDFPLVNTYTDSINPYGRFITRPVAATLKVYKNAVLQTLTTHYTFANGKVSFVAAPAISAAITAECEFDVPVQFMDDMFTVQMLHSTQGLVPTFKIEEVNEYAQLTT